MESELQTSKIMSFDELRTCFNGWSIIYHDLQIKHSLVISTSYHCTHNLLQINKMIYSITRMFKRIDKLFLQSL